MLLSFYHWPFLSSWINVVSIQSFFWIFGKILLSEKYFDFGKIRGIWNFGCNEFYSVEDHGIAKTVIFLEF